MSDKQYVGLIKTQQTQYGDMLKLSLGPKDLDLLNNWAAANGGWVRMDLSKRKEVSEKGYTHSMWIDEWKPDTSQARQQLESQAQQVSNKPDPFDQDIPF